jgi:YggT family protein
MFVLANLINAIAQLSGILLELFFWAIVLRIVLSWANADPSNGLVRAVAAVTEPVLRPLRRLVPPYRMGGWDLSPLLACLAIYFVKLFLVSSLKDWADRLR